MMFGTTLLIRLAGAITLLLWGSHMISTALQRGFGTPPCNWMGCHFTSRWTALLSGIGITGILQSSTAVSMMATSFTATGTLSLAPALAVMLGANTGSTLMAQLISFNMEIAIPLLLLAGFVVFKLRDHSSFENVGCALTGLSLMLLTLHLLGGTLQDIEVTPVLHVMMQELQDDVFIAPLVATLLTLLCHSGVAMILLTASLAGTDTLTPSTALVPVLGTNIGGALPSMLNAGSAVARRLPVGNLMVHLSGCALALLLLPLLMAITRKSRLNTPQLVIWFHTAFSVALALPFTGLSAPMARFLERLFSEEERVGDPGMPMYLDDAGLEVTHIGLFNSVRESLRVADMLAITLDRLLVLLMTQEKQAADDIHQLEQSVDLFSAAVRAYLVDIGQDGLNDADTDRVQEILMFIISVEHAGDILSSSLTQLATRRARRGEQFSDFELHYVRLPHAEFLTNLNLGIVAFLREDLSVAHQLVWRKETIRQLEASASREHFKKLREDKNVWAEPGDTFQRVLRDYRRVHHHIAAVAYPAIDRLGGTSLRFIEAPPDV